MITCYINPLYDLDTTIKCEATDYSYEYHLITLQGHW